MRGCRPSATSTITRQIASGANYARQKYSECSQVQPPTMTTRFSQGASITTATLFIMATLVCTINQSSGRATSRLHTGHKCSKSDKKYPRHHILDDENITSMKILCSNRHIGMDDVYHLERRFNEVFAWAMRFSHDPSHSRLACAG
jgi:hypothetical protein